MTTIQNINAAEFFIPATGHPELHRNLEWFGTDDNKLIGVVLLDLIDNDYSWVVFGDNGEQPGYRALLTGVSYPNQLVATVMLHKGMLDYHKQMEG